MDLNEYVKFNDSKALFKIKVTPKSAKNEFFWVLDNWVLKFRIKWIPEKGRVNEELILFISKELKIKKHNIKIVSWKTDQNKTIQITLS